MHVFSVSGNALLFKLYMLLGLDKCMWIVLVTATTFSKEKKKTVILIIEEEEDKRKVLQLIKYV